MSAAFNASISICRCHFLPLFFSVCSSGERNRGDLLACRERWIYQTSACSSWTQVWVGIIVLSPPPSVFFSPLFTLSSPFPSTFCCQSSESCTGRFCLPMSAHISSTCWVKMRAFLLLCGPLQRLTNLPFGEKQVAEDYSLCVCVLCSCCSLHPNRQMAHGLQMAEIAQYKKRKAEQQQQEQLAKKKNWGNVMHYKKMYNITGLVGNMTRPLANIVWGLVGVNCLKVSLRFVCICLHLEHDLLKV